MHGINRKFFVPLSIKQKTSLVLAFWLVSAGFLYILNSKQNSQTLIDSAAALQSVSFEKNHMGRCRFGLSDPSDKHLLGTVSFESLETHSAKTGPFKTAALREMEVKQLKIDLSGSSPSPPISCTIDKSAGESFSSERQQWNQVLMQKLSSQPLDQQDVLQVMLPDFSHLVQLHISDFQCRFLDGQNIVLNIQSKKASVATNKTAEMILKGHVIVCTPAAILESNSLRWDIQNQTFQVQGFYSIRTKNGLEKGYDGFFDPELNKLTQLTIFANKGEKIR